MILNKILLFACIVIGVCMLLFPPYPTDGGLLFNGLVFAPIWNPPIAFEPGEYFKPFYELWLIEGFIWLTATASFIYFCYLPSRASRSKEPKY